MGEESREAPEQLAWGLAFPEATRAGPLLTQSLKDASHLIWFHSLRDSYIPVLLASQYSKYPLIQATALSSEFMCLLPHPPSPCGHVIGRSQMDLLLHPN